MRFALILLASLSLGCATLNRFEPLCKVALSPQVCEALDVFGDLVTDVREAGDLVMGEDEAE